MKSYLNLVTDVLTNGTDTLTRAVSPSTGKRLNARSVFGRMWRHNLSDGFPLLTTKHVPFRLVAEELFWFIRGNSDVWELQEKNVPIWNAWAYDPNQEFGGRKTPNFPNEQPGSVGPAYGYQWRHWQSPDGNEVDQLTNLVETLKTNPTDRRMIVSAWNPSDNPKMGLPPCHYAFQVNTKLAHSGFCSKRSRVYDGFGFEALREVGGCDCDMTDRELNLMVNMRSADLFLGVPFNIASYALLTHMLANVAGMIPGELIFSFADLHVYENHFDQFTQQTKREPRPLPTLVIPIDLERLDDLSWEKTRLVGYSPHEKILGEVGV